MRLDFVSGAGLVRHCRGADGPFASAGYQFPAEFPVWYAYTKVVREISLKCRRFSRDMITTISRLGDPVRQAAPRINSAAAISTQRFRDLGELALRYTLKQAE